MIVGLRIRLAEYKEAKAQLNSDYLPGKIVQEVVCNG